MTPENPTWVPATIEFEGNTWTNVGVRYKGNSSLTSGWRSGTLKLPLKLDFDEFEDDYPEIDDQRFYGFKQFDLPLVWWTGR
jgi:spore coat protein CotH